MRTPLYILCILLVVLFTVACASQSNRTVMRESSGIASDQETSSSPDGAIGSDSNGNMRDVMNYEVRDEDADAVTSGPDSEEPESGESTDSTEESDDSSGDDDEENTGDAVDDEPVDDDSESVSDSLASRGSYELIPEGWPDYIPLIDGLTIRYSGSDEAGMQLVAIGPVPQEDVESFYRNLPDWELEPPRLVPDTREAPSDEEDVVTTTSFQLTREEELLTVILVQNEDETILQLMYAKLE